MINEKPKTGEYYNLVNLTVVDGGNHNVDVVPWAKAMMKQSIRGMSVGVVE